MLPHQPYVARRQDYEYYYETMYPPQNIEPFGDHLHPHIKLWREASVIVQVSDEEIRRARAAY